MIAPFRWNHADLDRVCGSLNDFSSLLLSFTTQKDLDWVWGLALENLVKNIRAAGLQPFIFDERSQPLSLLDSMPAQAADVLVVRSTAKSPDWRPLRDKVSVLPGAVLLFGEGMPSEWFTTYDMVLEFYNQKCRVFDRSGRPSVESPCQLDLKNQTAPVVTGSTGLSGAKSKPSPSGPAVASSSVSSAATTVVTGATQNVPAIYTIDLTPARKNEIAEALGTEDVRVVAVKRQTVMQEGLAVRQGDLVIIEASENEAWLAGFFHQTIALGVPVIVSAQKVKREEDRIRLYDLGATLVLSKDLKESEVVAMIGSITRLVNFGKIEPHYPFKEWDEEFQRLSEKLKRDLFWKKGAATELKDYYRPVVAHLMRRSLLSSTPCGAMVVPLPEVPSFVQKSGWSNLMQRTLLQSLISIVRQKDITFVFDEHLILISSDLSPLTSAYVVKRIQTQLEGLEEKSKMIEKVSIDLQPTQIDAQAEKMLNQILEKIAQEPVRLEPGT